MVNTVLLFAIKTSVIFRFISIDGVEDSTLLATWKKELTDLKLRTLARAADMSIKDLPSFFKPPLTLEQQLDFLGHTPNSHYDKYLLVKRNLIATRAPSLHNHLLYSPLNATKANNNYAPTSFRQRILYFLFAVTKANKEYVRRTIQYRLTDQHFVKRTPLETPKEKRRRLVKPKEQNVNKSPGLSPEAVINQYKLSEGYDIFREQMLMSGSLIVRNTGTVGGRLIMNACETKCGTIQVDKFVSLIYTKSPDQNLDLECNCPDYKRTAGDRGHELDPEGKWMDKKTRCMHVRLLYENFEDYLMQVPDVCEPEPGPLQHLQQQLRLSSLTSANAEVVVVSHSNYLILSVSLRLGDLPVFVKIHPSTHDTTSSCKCNKRIIKNRREYWLITTEKEKKKKKVEMCMHISAVTKYTNLLHQFLTKERRTDIPTRAEKIESFSKEKGKWMSASLLKHKPKQKMDEAFQR